MAVRARRSARRTTSAPSRSCLRRSRLGSSSAWARKRSVAASPGLPFPPPSPRRAAPATAAAPARPPPACLCPSGCALQGATGVRKPSARSAPPTPATPPPPRSPAARRGARRRPPAARTRRARRGRASRRRSCRRSCMSSLGSESKRTCWQREAIVGSTSSRCSASRIKCANGRRLLERLEQAVGGLVVHRARRLDHEHPARGLDGVCATAATTGSSMSLYEHFARAARGSPRSGRGGRRARRVPPRSPDRARRRRASAAAKPLATARLPAPAGPWNR